MLPIKTILHPTDFSSPSSHALRLATALARDYSAGLILVHIRQPPAVVAGEFGVIPPPPEEPAEAVEARIRQLLPPDYKGRVECQVRDGHAATEILRLAKDRACDLIVLGTHGRTGLGRLLMGSVAEEIIRKAPCAVLTVKTPSSAPEGGQG